MATRNGNAKVRRQRRGRHGLTVDGAGATGVDLTAELRGGHGKDVYAVDLADNVTVIDTQKV